MTGPHDESADAKAHIAAALAATNADKKPLLVMFGANWCGDCKMLDMVFKEGASAQRLRWLGANSAVICSLPGVAGLPS